MPETRLQTDLNQRERRRFAQALRSLAAGASRAADDLEAEEDHKAIVEIVALALKGRTVSELMEIADQALDVAQAAMSLDENQDFS